MQNCVVRESNPGHLLGRQIYYHCTNDAPVLTYRIGLIKRWKIVEEFLRDSEGPSEGIRSISKWANNQQTQLEEFGRDINGGNVNHQFSSTKRRSWTPCFTPYIWYRNKGVGTSTLEPRYLIFKWGSSKQDIWNVKIHVKKEEVLPGLEPGSVDSKSTVITSYTIGPPQCMGKMSLYYSQWLVVGQISIASKSVRCGVRTHASEETGA